MLPPKRLDESPQGGSRIPMLWNRMSPSYRLPPILGQKQTTTTPDSADLSERDTLSEIPGAVFHSTLQLPQISPLNIRSRLQERLAELRKTGTSMRSSDSSSSATFNISACTRWQMIAIVALIMTCIQLILVISLFHTMGSQVLPRLNYVSLQQNNTQQHDAVLEVRRQYISVST